MRAQTNLVLSKLSPHSCACKCTSDEKFFLYYELRLCYFLSPQVGLAMGIGVFKVLLPSS